MATGETQLPLIYGTLARVNVSRRSRDSADNGDCATSYTSNRLTSSLISHCSRLLTLELAIELRGRLLSSNRRTCYSAPVGVRCIVINPSVCVSVRLSVREHISGTAGPIGTKFRVRVSCGRGSVLLRRRCAPLCTSGLPMTSHLAVVGRTAMVRYGRRSLMPMNVCSICCEFAVQQNTAVEKPRRFVSISYSKSKFPCRI